MEINILHLYYDILNLYGEYGNVVILKKHIEDQGFKVNVERKSVDDEIDLKKYDFIYMGCGTEKSLDCVLDNIKKYKEQFKEIIDKNKVILATGNSFEMFGKSIDKEEGLDIFDYEVIRLKERVTSDVIYLPETDELQEKIIGFVNKMTETYHNMMPLFEVYFGVGENKKNDYEGVHFNNFFGTHVSGPILTKNPEFLKMVVTKICKNVNKEFEYKEIEYVHENAAYKLTLEELEKRKME